MKVQIFADFEEALNADINIQSDKKIELVIDYCIPQFAGKPVPADTIRFFCTIQPEGHYNEIIKAEQRNYNYLLTFIPELLTLSKAKFFIGLTPFVRPNPSAEKIFGVSAVFSGRNCLPGHRLRFELWNRRNEIKIPRYFYVGRRTMMPGVDYEKELVIPADKNTKEIAMQTMFHICIDSYDYDNSFSEKLIDPMISKVVPIYWGAKNAVDFFHPYGFAQLNNVSEIIDFCNTLEPGDYEPLKNYIDINYKKALNYVDYGKQLQKKIQEVINENK